MNGRNIAKLYYEEPRFIKVKEEKKQYKKRADYKTHKSKKERAEQK